MDFCIFHQQSAIAGRPDIGGDMLKASTMRHAQAQCNSRSMLRDLWRCCACRRPPARPRGRFDERRKLDSAELLCRHSVPWSKRHSTRGSLTGIYHLLSCYSSMGDVERCHKLTSRHRSKYSNKKLDSTTESYCEIAIAESNKRRREKDGSHGPTVIEAFRSRMHAAVRARKEREAAAQAIEEARAALEADDSDDDTAPRNGFDEILDEICDEDGYESEDSEGEAW